MKRRDILRTDRRIVLRTGAKGMAESFIKTFKRDYVRMHELSNAKCVMKQLPQWFEDYNEYHPHKGLKMMSPREYIKLIERTY